MDRGVTPERSEGAKRPFIVGLTGGIGAVNVDALDDDYGGALSPITVPMGRQRNAPTATGGEAATLYAPTGRAAKAYRAVARDVAARLGLAPERRSE